MTSIPRERTTGYGVLSRFNHWTAALAFMAAIVLMPLSGILMTVAGDRALAVWDVTLVPSIGQIDWLDALAAQIHGALGLFITAVLTLHIAAAMRQLVGRVMHPSLQAPKPERKLSDDPSSRRRKSRP